MLVLSQKDVLRTLSHMHEITTSLANKKTFFFLLSGHKWLTWSGFEFTIFRQMGERFKGHATLKPRPLTNLPVAPEQCIFYELPDKEKEQSLNWTILCKHHLLFYSIYSISFFHLSLTKSNVIINTNIGTNVRSS